MPCATIWSEWNMASTADRSVSSSGFGGRQLASFDLPVRGFSRFGQTFARSRGFSDLSLNPELFAAGQASQLSAGRMSRPTGFSRKPWIFASKLRHDAFSMDGGERSVFSRVVKTALDRQDDSGATADMRSSDSANMTSRHLVAAHFTQK